MSEDLDTVSQVLKTLRGDLKDQIGQQLISLLNLVRTQTMVPGLEPWNHDELTSLASKFAVAGDVLRMQEELALEIATDVDEASLDGSMSDGFSEPPRRSN